ncbi:hypothetical protein [Sphingobacterium siyangense]|uniref:hypothetical protein n=1 Tax=Sphingobacterium siyangense TaxID=459529 RepID=UPI003C72D64F
MANSILWYTNQKGGVASDNCNKSYESLFSPSATTFVTNKFVFTTTCSYDPAVTATLTLFLDKATSINMEGKGGLILMSDKSFFEVKRNGEKITPDLNTTIKILNISDNEKVLKAFKHLFKLLNIQLVDDMF